MRTGYGVGWVGVGGGGLSLRLCHYSLSSCDTVTWNYVQEKQKKRKKEKTRIPPGLDAIWENNRKVAER